MKILFIHQSFPGQFKNIVRYLAANADNDVRFISRPNANGIPSVRRYTYEPARESAKQTHHYVRDLERGVLNGQAVALKIRELLASGFHPDVVVGHSGWGETLFIKDVLPSTPLLSYFEFFYKAFGADTNFDPEYPLGLDDSFRIRIKNAVNHTGMDAADWGLTPTNWQRSLYPAWAQKRMTVLHEGIDTNVIVPNPNACFRLPNGVGLSPGAKVVTYVARNLEPYRGIHTFVRSIPGILERQRDAVIVVVGGNSVSYGRTAQGDESHLSRLMKEVGADWSRVWFLGQIPYQDYLSLLQVSAAHVYLTYPFVLSWSMLEAMAAGCLVIGSSTPPVEEVIRDGHNGLLVDFFGADDLARAVHWALDHPSESARIRQRARQHVETRYDFARCIRPQFEALLTRLAKPVPPAVRSRSRARLNGRSQEAGGNAAARVWHAVH